VRSVSEHSNRSFRYETAAIEGMPIAITTPGVPPAVARKAVRPAGKPTVVEATRCGRVTLPRSDATLLVCVRLCDVSMQTAQRVLAAVPAEATPIVCLLITPQYHEGCTSSSTVQCGVCRSPGER